MPMQTRVKTLGAFFILSAFASVSMAADDPFTGTWALDPVASNKEGQGYLVLLINIVGDRESYRNEFLMPNGTHEITHYQAPFDGKQYPSETITTKPDGVTKVVRKDFVSLKRTGPREEERRHTNPHVVIRRSVSADGNTLFIKENNLDASGHEGPVVENLVFKRVSQTAQP